MIAGPLYLGDLDWGRWKIETLPPGCVFVGATVLHGPIRIQTVSFPIIEVQAKPLAPGETKPAEIRFIFNCAGCDCSLDLPVTVQAYDRIELEARVFIPCELACAVEPVLILMFPNDPDRWYRCFKGDCRSFDCGDTPLPTTTDTPSSRVMVGIDFRMRLDWTATSYAGRAESQEANAWGWSQPSYYALCGSTVVPVGDSFSNCDASASSFYPPCPLPPGYTPPTPTITDLSFGAPTVNDVVFVGSPRYKRVRMPVREADSCVPHAPAVDMRAQVGIWQRCDPTQGMQRARYDFWWEHDYYPAYELVYERTSHDGSFSQGCLSVSTPTLGPAAGLLGPDMAVQEIDSTCGVPHSMDAAGWPKFWWYDVTPTCPWEEFP
ncbi:MAG: hypothetical protein GC172_09775 [Phycisphaera sp.]|nr:hypothetical protein [Phycisphaera sp.]